MEGLTRHDLNLASRKAEEVAWRRYQAVEWLKIFVGPFGLPDQPSERDFVSCLRNGQILCNLINKIQPGAVTKVVENNFTLQSLNRDTQTLTAYQYFENVRNFLMAMEELKLPAFEASDLERDNLEAGSAAKVVDCILGLKAFYEWKLSMRDGNGLYYKHMRSPLVMHSAAKIHGRVPAGSLSESCRRLFDMSTASEMQPHPDEVGKLEETIAKLIADRMFEAKENIDKSFLASLSNGNMGPFELFKKLISSCLEDPLKKKIPGLNSVFEDSLEGKDRPVLQSRSSPLEDISALRSKSCRSCLGREMTCNHKSAFLMQEKKLQNLKTLLSKTKREFADLKIQFERDLKELGTQVEEISVAALSHHKVLKENRILYNMVQDLKGTIRVYCRIRPISNVKCNSVIDFMGEDGTLVILDPSKSQREGKKVFQLNKVFGPTASQDDVYMDAQPLIRSVMDGYNVCIFAYGQTGSGKTHTMSGPPDGKKDTGINYLALNDLLEISNSRKDTIEYDICVQMVEIYNEQVRDLLADDLTVTKLEIRSCAGAIDNGLSLLDATLRPVNSPADVINLMEHGDINRIITSTKLNNRSSRSHGILTVHVHGKDTSGGITRGCLHLVDLAGSERVDIAEVTGERLKEAQFINKSLCCLGDVITALAQKSSHVPYRNSKLTLLLQDSLGRNAKTLMFAHVNPEEASFGETVSTLKFVQRISIVELGVAYTNKETSEVMQLKQQVESLKKALANKDVQSIQQNGTRDPKSPQGKAKILTDRTPPCPPRLIMEYSSYITKIEKPVNYEQRKAAKSPTSVRAQRLSMKGPTHAKKEKVQTTNDDAGCSPSSQEIQMKNQGLSQEKCTVLKSYGHLSHGVSSMKENLDSLQTTSSFSFSKKVKKLDDQTQSHPLELMKTPELLVDLSIDRQMSSTVINSTNGKSSHIKKSLRTTIGKFINRSERRTNRNTVEARSPVRGISLANNSAGSEVARTVRRQSLTRIPTPGVDRSRRSSLGGKSTDSNANDTRNAKTPPPVHPSPRAAKKWL